MNKNVDIRKSQLVLDVKVMGPIIRIPIDLEQEWQLNMGVLEIQSIDTNYMIQLKDFIFMYKMSGNGGYEYYLMENRQLVIDIKLAE